MLDILKGLNEGYVEGGKIDVSSLRNCSEFFAIQSIAKFQWPEDTSVKRLHHMSGISRETLTIQLKVVLLNRHGIKQK